VWLHLLTSCALLTDAPDVVVNPKINNMLQGYGAAKYKLLWMVDANILVTPDTLQEMVVCSESGTDVGLVHQVPFWATKPTFASALNQVYFGGPHARIYLASNALGAVCASGMSFMLKKSVLEDIGGLEHFGQYLAEDFFLARDLRKKGYKIILSSLPALQNPGACSVELFKARLSRWIRLRTSMIPFPSLLEPLIDCFVMGLLSSLVFSYLLGYSFFLFYGFHICIVMVSDYILLRNLQNGPLLNWKMLFLAWWVRELLALPIYLHGVSSRKVRWKDREFTLMCGGQVKETTPPPKHIISV
jgi:ceramide glucosyltransferase